MRSRIPTIGAGRSGFTLVEVLVALDLAGIVSIAMAATFRHGFHFAGKLGGIVDRYEAKMQILSGIDYEASVEKAEELNQEYPPLEEVLRHRKTKGPLFPNLPLEKGARILGRYALRVRYARPKPDVERELTVEAKLRFPTKKGVPFFNWTPLIEAYELRTESGTGTGTGSGTGTGTGTGAGTGNSMGKVECPEPGQVLKGIDFSASIPKPLCEDSVRVLGRNYVGHDDAQVGCEGSWATPELTYKKDICLGRIFSDITFDTPFKKIPQLLVSAEEMAFTSPQGLTRQKTSRVVAQPQSVPSPTGVGHTGQVLFRRNEKGEFVGARIYCYGVVTEETAKALSDTYRAPPESFRNASLRALCGWIAVGT